MTMPLSFKQRCQSAVPRGVRIATSICAEHAEGSEIWDHDKQRYIDFASGISALNVGHRHPHVMAAVQQQLQHFTHTA